MLQDAYVPKVSVGVEEQSNGSDIITTAYDPKGSVGCGKMSDAVSAAIGITDTVCVPKGSA